MLSPLLVSFLSMRGKSSMSFHGEELTNKTQENMFIMGNFTVGPGKRISLEGRGRFIHRDKDCDAKMHNIKNISLFPETVQVNGSYYPSALEETNFGNLSGLNSGYKEKNFKSLKENPVNFLLWYPQTYSLTMQGEIHCPDIMIAPVSIIARVNIIVKNFTSDVNSFQNNSYCKLSYNITENLVGTGCSVFTEIHGNLSANYDFKWLSLIDNFEASTTAGNEKSALVSGSNTRALLCADSEISPSGCQSGLHSGSTTSLASLFSVPYFSKDSCDYNKLELVSRYDFSFKYSTYLMIKEKGVSSFWVPVAMWAGEFKNKGATCISSDGCGTGLGFGKEPFSSPWQVNEKVFLTRSTNFSLPSWNQIFQDVASNSSYLSLAAYFEESTGNSWITCRNSTLKVDAIVDKVFIASTYEEIGLTIEPLLNELDI